MNNEYEYSYLNEAGIANVIPSTSTFTEDAMYTIASIEESYNAIMKNVGVIELDTVMEADGNGFSLKKLWEKFKDFVKGLWEKFVELVKTARDRITYFVINKFKFFKDKKLSASAIAKAIEADYKKDSVKATNRWKKYAGAYYDYDDVKGSALSGAVNTVMKDTVSYIKKLKSKNAEKAAEGVEGIVANMLAPTLGLTAAKMLGYSAQEIKDEITKYVSKPVNITEPGKFVQSNADSLWKALDNSKEKFDKSIKNPYKKCKENLDKAVKDAKKTIDTSDYKALFRIVTAGSKCYSSIVGAIEQSYIRSIVWKFKLLHAAAGLVTVSESAVEENGYDMSYQSTSFQTELSSLWDL